MSHPTEGELRAFLDGEASGTESGEIEAHLQVCASCRALRDELVDNAALIREALERLVGDPATARARRAVERRLSRTRGAADGLREDDPRRSREAESLGGSTRPARSRRRRRDLLRAAAVAVLLLAGVSAALPGSPVNAWLLRTLDRDAAVGEDPVPGPGGATVGPSSVDSAEGSADDVAVRVEPRDGMVRVELRRVDPGTRVRIVLVDGGRAGISARGAEGFRSGAGFVAVTGPGELVTIDLPRSVPGAEIRSEDRLLLRKNGSSLEFPTMIPDTDEGAFVLTIGDGTSRDDG